MLYFLNKSKICFCQNSTLSFQIAQSSGGLEIEFQEIETGGKKKCKIVQEIEKARGVRGG